MPAYFLPTSRKSWHVSVDFLLAEAEALECEVENIVKCLITSYHQRLRPKVKVLSFFELKPTPPIKALHIPLS